ncbi:glycosyltransferase [Phytohabitans aurantiacus]|uniref:Glycosyl transferase n=1 Tax=Phytohabitans aurantiacus TaxID=3016789 RepID=A0ABQ5QY63_9ACTN|nr:glycosyltransferase [Phytohabitans aurantiacus]GLH99139.1 glycosyl transferase [Phytohabitans aurantiacus]
MICLVPHCGYLSAVSRMLEIYRALRARGAPVRVATHGGTYEHLLRAAGVPYDQIGPPMTADRCARFLRDELGVGPVRQSMYSDSELYEYATAEADYFRAHRVTTVVTGFTLSTVLSTRLAGVKLVTEHAGSWVPPAFERRLLPPMRGLPRRLVNAAPPRVRFYCGGFNRVAARLGVAPVPSLAALVLGDLSLVPESPDVLGVAPADLEAWRPGRGYRPGTRLRYTGPLFAHLDVPLPPAVDEFLADGPVVYVAVNSSPPALVRALIRALPKDTKVLVAATVYDLESESSDRIMVAGVLPSHLIMPRVALAVTAGGQGTVQTAMAAGTPLLGVPLQPEQDLNLALLERLGAARRTRPATIRTDAARMLTDPIHREAAARVQKAYATLDGPGAAAEAILHA